MSRVNKKGTHKGIACRKGEPIFWNQQKKKFNISLTPEAIEVLTKIAEQEKISRSEVLERILRGILVVNLNTDREEIYYDETKNPVTVMFTPSTLKKLDESAEQEGLSRSEYLERLL